MKAKLIYSPFVKEDIKNGVQWYTKINKKLSQEFLKEYRAKIVFLSKNPNSAEIKYENHRISFLKIFPYGIHYEFFENENTIIVYAVFHTSRNPKIWIERA